MHSKIDPKNNTPAPQEQHEVRVEKVKKMEEQGINPWPAPKEINTTCVKVIQEFVEQIESNSDASPQAELSACLEIAGRILTLRRHGKTAFATLQDHTGKLQVYFKEEILGEQAFAFLSHSIDIGDIVWCKGSSFKTKTGEVTLRVDEYTLLSKCLYPLPEKFHGIADVEIKYRQRYLDLITDAESKERFIKRSRIVSTMRSFFNEHGFLEVETPMLHPIPGGALAKPFMTHHNALDMDLYLRIAPELYLKRLVVGGFDRVYEINRNFRNEGISTRHNPEFTMVEYYIAYHDYHFMMLFTEKLLYRVAHAVCHTGAVQFGEHILDFDAPFKRMTMREAVAQHLGYAPHELDEKKLDMVIMQHKIKLEQKNGSYGYKLTAIFEALVEITLIQPTFITQFPIEVSPLAKRNPENPECADRFELFVAGMELANGFNELNNPFDQAQRFKDQTNARAAGEQEAHYYDADYVHALEYGMPPTVGSGIGIDRLTMFLTNSHSIRDVILFPTLRIKE